MSKALEDIAAERRRQVEAEGWTPEHDDAHSNGELAQAAACYARQAVSRASALAIPLSWPWEDGWWKPGSHRRNLVKAAALMVAEIERLDRAEARAVAPAA